MRYCSNCGHELGVGRYCINCGHPVGAAPEPPPAPQDEDGWRTDTAERTAAVPPAPPTSPPPNHPPPAPAGASPAPPRFPLFADEVDDGTLVQPSPADPPSPHRRRSSPWPVWLAVAAVLTVVAVLGIWLLGGDDRSSDTAGAPAHTSSSAPPHHASHSASPSTTHSTTPSTTPSTQPGEVTSEATVDVPATAPPGQDLAGDPIDYAAANMLDGIPETTWRMPGDGTGKELTITLPGKTALRSVGLINGYAKTVAGPKGGTVDWYHGNRRIEGVQWVFDDGSTVDQDLTDTTGVQSVDVDVTTTTITLRLVAVSAPGTGPSSRDYTAISDLSLISAG